jgi:hypothetical protein
MIARSRDRRAPHSASRSELQSAVCRVSGGQRITQLRHPHAQGSLLLLARTYNQDAALAFALCLSCRVRFSKLACSRSRCRRDPHHPGDGSNGQDWFYHLQAVGGDSRGEGTGLCHFTGGRQGQAAVKKVAVAIAVAVAMAVTLTVAVALTVALAVAVADCPCRTQWSC